MNYSTTMTVVNITTAYCRVIVPPLTLTLTILSCCLSVLGSGVIIITYLNVPCIQNFNRKLLISLTIADLFTALGNLLGSLRYIWLISGENGCERVQISDGVCITQSFLTTLSSMASFFWTTVIAVHIYLQIQRELSSMRTGLMLIGYQVLCWSVPGIITITASALNVLGSDNSVGTGSWCWIRSQIDDKTQVIWMLISGKGWEITCYILTAGLYILSKITIWIKRRERNRQLFQLRDVGDMRNEDENFLYVPLVLYVLRIWGTVRFLLAVTNKNVNSVHIDRLQNVLLSFQGVGDSGQAFCNCILFCFCDKTVREYLFSVTCRRHTARELTMNEENDEHDERTPIHRHVQA